MAIENKYRNEIRLNLPVVYEGLSFYPLTVLNYELCEAARPSFELMQASLKNPRIARLPWCACLWALDEDCREKTGKEGRFLTYVLSVMAEALRLNAFADEENGGKKAYPIRPLFGRDMTLKGILVEADGRYVNLGMPEMNDVRRIIAAQNGYNIPEETWNPELVKAAQENAKGKTSGIVPDLSTLVYSVAFQCGVTAADVYQWTIRDFKGMQDAIDRSLYFQILATAEKSGYIKFKGGNPVPTWKFDKRSDLPTGFRTIADIDAGAKGLIQGV